MASDKFFQSCNSSIDHNMWLVIFGQTKRGSNLTRMEVESKGVPKKAKTELSPRKSLNQTNNAVATWSPTNNSNELR